MDRRPSKQTAEAPSELFCRPSVRVAKLPTVHRHGAALSFLEGRGQDQLHWRWQELLDSTVLAVLCSAIAESCISYASQTLNACAQE